MVAPGAGGELVRAVELGIGHDLPVCPPVTFAVRPGDAVAVVGANGAGKSTLLRTVVGLLDPLAGQLQVLGRDVDERSVEFRAAVAADLGDDAFFPALTAREHLLLTCCGHGVGEPAEVVDALLEEFGLTARAEALPAALSSGQRRRLLLAAALARPRSLLVLDEPEQRLDAGMRRALIRRLVEEREIGGAVLLATHDPAVVLGAATCGLLITEGSAEVVEPDAAAAAIEAL
ncbi:ATP-binding cassette domain-containing protein [Quadrisphaera sp. DSM 44207]|uniref:ABC transporter ATP-binding protein n=1 Tax=Quadrisphaera sp. DSM 44207 TaxID=1881057 RepID=UPI000883CE3C|nr:ATP-binding cassette domain-containing protein [Quadrisphaera sp. DSM 44207]SDQ10966.1 iron complex transport system ATP-binding protein/putative spermidine/putrescine transport system ATP-binding protein/macrolide transport system ATP-binding/permease protein/manganese/iron transport system ATP-binding protein [Quadrisphaera sp. DSM 44207]